MDKLGPGFYQWIDMDGALCTGTHWDEIPRPIKRLIAFIPEVPPDPHTQLEHEMMEGIHAKMKEVMEWGKQ